MAASALTSRLPKMRTLAAREAQLWFIPLSTGLESGRQALERLLSPAEAKSASRFRHGDDQRRAIHARGWLRLLLGRYTGLPPEALTIEIAADGKPWLAQDPGLHFNLSHGGGILLVGVTRVAPIGVDVEAVRALPGWPGIVRACFSRDERRFIADPPDGARMAAFFRVWTGKESAVKAIGTGLSNRLNRFAVIPAAAPNGCATVRGLDGPWTLLMTAPRPGYQAAVAVRAEGVMLRQEGLVQDGRLPCAG